MTSVSMSEDFLTNTIVVYWASGAAWRAYEQDNAEFLCALRMARISYEATVSGCTRTHFVFVPDDLLPNTNVNTNVNVISGQMPA